MDKVKLRNGNVLQGGQLHIMGDGRGYRQIGSDMARRDDAKVLPTPQIAHGQKRQTQGALHPYLHGRPLDDETADKLSHTGRSVPVHDGMGTHAGSAHERGIVAHVEDGSKHLRAAGSLSMADKIANAIDFDHSHIGHRVKRGASLPVNKRKLSE
jgi:hypothetical protein